MNHSLKRRYLKRSLTTLLALIAATTSLPGIAQKDAQGPIRIGEINSYKAQPAFLEPYKKGMELALEEVNTAGGVNAEPASFRECDGGWEPDADVDGDTGSEEIIAACPRWQPTT